jgi:hypothetical protein
VSELTRSVCLLDMSIMAAKHVLSDGNAPLQRRLSWLGAELERLATEAFRLADEAGDDSGPAPGPDVDFCICRKEPCTCG